MAPLLLVLDVSLTTTLVPCFCAVEIRTHELSRHLQKCSLSDVLRNVIYFFMYFCSQNWFFAKFRDPASFQSFLNCGSCAEMSSPVWIQFAIFAPEIWVFVRAIATVFWMNFPVYFLGHRLPLLHLRVSFWNFFSFGKKVEQGN